MVQGIPGDRQFPTLDGVGDDDDRLVGNPIGLVQPLQDLAQVMAAQIGQQRLDFIGGVAAQQFQQLLVLAVGGVDQPPPDLLAVLDAQQALVLVVAHQVDALSQFLAVGTPENPFQFVAILQLEHAPAVDAKHLLDLLGLAAGDDAVQALAIQVDDPEDLAQLLQGFFAQGLPHVSLIQLGIAHQGNETVAPGVPEMVAHKLPGQPGEVGNHGSQTHRPGGKVDLVHVLGTAGIGLKSVEAAKLAELLFGQVAEEILDGVVHRGAVGLDGDPVSKS